MKKLLLFSLTGIILIAGCKKVTKEPLGPTDVRVLNLSDVPMTSVTVNTFDSTYTYGSLGPGDTTEYHRFDRAYSKANISALINGLTYKTDTAIYTWMNYLGKVKATYEIYIKNEAQKKLEISNVVLESSLK